MLSNISPKKPFTSPATTQRYRPDSLAMQPPRERILSEPGPAEGSFREPPPLHSGSPRCPDPRGRIDSRPGRGGSCQSGPEEVAHAETPVPGFDAPSSGSARPAPGGRVRDLDADRPMEVR